MSIIDVIIPARNEAKAIGHVIGDIPRDMVRHIYVSDNGSQDNTAAIAHQHGATVIDVEKAGYGRACQAAIAHIAQQDNPPHIIVFLDGDYSDYPQEMTYIIEPIVQDEYDLVIGSRVLGQRAKGSMTIPQIFGNWLSTSLIKLFFGYTYTDLGPFRAIKYTSLQKLSMQDLTYGWTVEMQVKAAKLKMKTKEVPVSYKKRIGKSKVSGTIKGTILAGYKILWTIFKSI